jgi:hypothetical protein
VLIVEPAGLLPADRVDFEGHASLAHPQRPRMRAVTDVGIVGQRFELAHRAIVLPDQRRGLQHLDHGFADLLAQALHAGGADLPHDHVVETFQHQSRQTVGFPEHEAVVRFGMQLLAQ